MTDCESFAEILKSEVLPKLVPVLERRIKAYHENFSLPLIAEYWEEVLHRSFTEIGYPTTWTPERSHRVGEDMRIVGVPNSRISCKSGQIVTNKQLGKECVKFNGSRSTKFETLTEKLDHFAKNHDDCYFLLAKKKKFDKTYTLIVFDSTVCNVKNLEWCESESGKQWNGSGQFVANIGKAMSAQLWTTLPIDMINHQHSIDCNTSEKPMEKPMEKPIENPQKKSPKKNSKKKVKKLILKNTNHEKS